MSGFLGIIKLDTRFPRPKGDIGNADSFAFPVRYAVVEGASPQRVVTERAAGLLEPFIAAGRRLIDEGALAITTTCGFLTIFQRQLASALPVPVATSALLQVPWVQTMIAPGQRVGVLTISATSITPAHLDSAGIAADSVAIEGVAPSCEFATKLLGNQTTLDVDAARADVVEAARALVTKHPEVGAIVMECTNMPPYRAAVAAATDLAVYDSLGLAEWLWRGVAASAKIPSEETRS